MAKGRSGLSKLFATGVAYVQHVKFVDRAYLLPQQEVAEVVETYVRSLSDASRAGFRLTVLTLAQRERSDPRRKQFLLAVVGLVDGSAAAPEPASTPSVVAATCYEQNVELVSVWFPLSDTERRSAVRRHVASLSETDRDLFRRHVSQMCSTIARQIDDHDADEDKAWGPYIEDQMNYRMAKLRTGRSDPRWLEERQALMDYATLFELVSATAG